jgi:hypothetical protein
MKRLRWLGRMLLGLARELSDENAYRRHLAAHHRQHSAEEWRRFSEAHLRAKYSRAKCCGVAVAVALSLSTGRASAQSSLPPLPGTWFSIERSTLAAVHEWGGPASWVLQPQTEFHLVK